MNIKKITFFPAVILTLVSSAFSQATTEWSGSATYGFESEYIFRGYYISGDTFTPSAEGRFNDENSSLYLGVRTQLPSQKDDNKNKLNQYYAGGEFNMGEDFIVDLGVSYYQFLPFTDDSPAEATIGLTWDVLLSPAVYAYLDFDGDMTTFEGSVGHAFTLDQQSAIIWSAYVGQSDFALGSTYAGLILDYSYSFTRYARLTLGGRLATLDPDAPDGSEFESDTRAWWGVSFTAGF